MREKGDCEYKIMMFLDNYFDRSEGEINLLLS